VQGFRRWRRHVGQKPRLAAGIDCSDLRVEAGRRNQTAHGHELMASLSDVPARRTTHSLSPAPLNPSTAVTNAPSTPLTDDSSPRFSPSTVPGSLHCGRALHGRANQNAIRVAVPSEAWLGAVSLRAPLHQTLRSGSATLRPPNIQTEADSN